MPHPDEGLIHAWLDGELDAAESARVSVLVARDAEWAAAAAEARGLIAASSRIAGALDRIPGRVIPATKPGPRATRWWMMRVAALLLVMAGATTILRHEVRDPTLRGTAGPAQPAPKPAQKPAPSPASAAPIPKGAIVAAEGSLSGKTLPREDRAAAAVQRQTAASGDLKQRANERKAIDALRDARVADLAARRTSMTAARGATNQAAPTTPPATPPAAASPAAIAGMGALGLRASASRADSSLAKAEKDQQAPSFVARREAAKAADAATVQLRCFEFREPADSAMRLIKLPAVVLADSVRLGVLQLRGDSLLGASRRFVAIAVRCPEP